MRDVELGEIILHHERVDGFFSSEGTPLKYSLFVPDVLVEQPRGVVLLLHGASTAGGRGRVLFEGLQVKLATLGFASFAFDTRGVGGSGGEFHDSTLINRLIDAENAYEFLLSHNFVAPEKLVILGVSMRGHVAVRLVGAHPEKFQGLILVNPAAYGPEAEDKRLKPYTEFTDTIARELNWQDSLAFADLSKFSGQIMLADSELDDVIPAGVKERYRLCSVSLSKQVVLPGIKHIFFSGTDEVCAHARELFYQEAAVFVQQL